MGFKYFNKKGKFKIPSGHPDLNKDTEIYYKNRDVLSRLKHGERYNPIPNYFYVKITGNLYRQYNAKISKGVEDVPQQKNLDEIIDKNAQPYSQPAEAQSETDFQMSSIHIGPGTFRAEFVEDSEFGPQDGYVPDESFNSEEIVQAVPANNADGYYDDDYDSDEIQQSVPPPNVQQPGSNGTGYTSLQPQQTSRNAAGYTSLQPQQQEVHQPGYSSDSEEVVDGVLDELGYEAKIQQAMPEEYSNLLQVQAQVIGGSEGQDEADQFYEESEWPDPGVHVGVHSDRLPQSQSLHHHAQLPPFQQQQPQQQQPGERTRLLSGEPQSSCCSRTWNKFKNTAFGNSFVNNMLKQSQGRSLLAFSTVYLIGVSGGLAAYAAGDSQHWYNVMTTFFSRDIDWDGLDNQGELQAVLGEAPLIAGGMTFFAETVIEGGVTAVKSIVDCARGPEPGI